MRKNVPSSWEDGIRKRSIPLRTLGLRWLFQQKKILLYLENIADFADWPGTRIPIKIGMALWNEKFRISFWEWRELMIHSAWNEPEKHLFSLSVAAVPASRLTLSAESVPKRIFRNGKNIETDARENGWALPLNRVAIGWKFCFKVGGRRKKNARPVFYGARVWGVVAFERRCFSEGEARSLFTAGPE